MPIQKLRNALDVNGDGVIDHRDAIVAAKIAGATVVGAGATALASASAGSAIVATGATVLAGKVAAIAGAAAGVFIATTVGTTTTAAFGIFQIGSSVIVATSSVTVGLSAKLAALTAGGGALLGQVGTNTIAGLPIVQKIALANAVAAKDVIVIGGVTFGVTAAITMGLIAIVIVGGYAYYLLTKDRLDESEVEFGVPILT